jgi:hypothetical protein
MIASLPTPPPCLKLNIGPEFYETLRSSRDNEKRIAMAVLATLPP